MVALAGESFGGIRPANFLDIGGGGSAEVMADGLEIVLSDTSVRSVLVNVFGGITSCDAVANGIVSALGMLSSRGERVAHPMVAGWTATTPTRAAASWPMPAFPSWSRWRPSTTQPGARPNWPPPPRDRSMRWRFSCADSRVMIQGITGSEGTKHGRRMQAAGTTVVGGTNPRKAGQTVNLGAAAVPVFGTVAETMVGHRRRCLGRVRPARGHQGGGDRGRGCRHPAGDRDHRGHPGA